jgi:hypothetical protein
MSLMQRLVLPPACLYYWTYRHHSVHVSNAASSVAFLHACITGHTDGTLYMSLIQRLELSSYMPVLLNIQTPPCIYL